MKLYLKLEFHTVHELRQTLVEAFIISNNKKPSGKNKKKKRQGAIEMPGTKFSKTLPASKLADGKNIITLRNEEQPTTFMEIY